MAGRSAALAALLLGMVPLAGSVACVSSESVSESASASVKSISTSLQTVSGSLSRSSKSSAGGDEAASLFRGDVRSLVAAAVRAGTGDDELLRDLGRTASEHGVVRWEVRDDAWRAVGAGLRDAGVDAAEASLLARRLAPDDPRAQGWLAEGYDS